MNHHESLQGSAHHQHYHIKGYRIVAFALLLITLAVNVAMPLFRVYAAAADLNNVQTSLVFAAYIAGMLPCYVFLGGLSDRTGRKTILLFALTASILATSCVAIWPGVPALIVARFLQGVGVGLGMGAGTAFLSELYPHREVADTRAANTASLMTSFGFGGGALATSCSLIIHFSLTPFTYYLLLAISVIGLVLLLTVPESAKQETKLIRLPFFPRGSLPLNLAIAVCWAATGVVIAILPTQLAVYHLTAYAGFCLVLVNWSGALIQPLLRNRNPLFLVRTGLYLIPLGFLLVIAGSKMGWLWLILAGTTIVGFAAYGFSYLGGLALITNLGGIHKARAVSGYMFTGYIGFGIPAIGLGFFADHFGILQAMILFECLVIGTSAWIFYMLKKQQY